MGHALIFCLIIRVARHQATDGPDARGRRPAEYHAGATMHANARQRRPGD